MTPADPTAPAIDPNTATPLPTVSLLTEPTFEECVVHHSRYSEDHNAGRISLKDIPHGHYIAYYDGQIRDHDPDAAALLKRAATSLNVHPARILIHYPWVW